MRAVISAIAMEKLKFIARETKNREPYDRVNFFLGHPVHILGSIIYNVHINLCILLERLVERLIQGHK